jgi:hypothetical protein
MTGSLALLPIATTSIVGLDTEDAPFQLIPVEMTSRRLLERHPLADIRSPIQEYIPTYQSPRHETGECHRSVPFWSGGGHVEGDSRCF